MLLDPQFPGEVVGFVLQFHHHLGIDLVEGFQDLRHPLGCHAGEDPHPQQFLLADPGGLLEAVLHGFDLPHNIQQADPHLRGRHAALVSVEDFDAQLVFDVVDDVPQAWLGVTHGLGCPGHAAAFGSLQNRCIFTHSLIPP